MGVRGGLESAGEWLVGDVTVNPAWLQQTHSAITPQGDFMCLARGQKFILFRANQGLNKRDLTLVHQGTVQLQEDDEEVTSASVFPFITSSKIDSKSFYTALGFNTGMVRIYDESGTLVVQKCFQMSAVKSFKFQSIPEGKQSTNILYTQPMQELLIVYSSMVVSVSSLDLFQAIYDNNKLRVSSSGNKSDFEDTLSAIKGYKFLIKEEKVSDCEAIVLTNSTYYQYFQLTMKGGMVDDRYKPVITKPYILTVGQDPFLQYNEKSSTSVSAGELAHNVVSTVTSGIFKVASGAFGSLWSGGGGQVEVKPPPSDPQVMLSIAHSLKDSGRDGIEVHMSPNKMYSAIRDSQNRVLLVDNYSRTIVQMWRGYHRCQMGWVLAGQPKLTTSSQRLEDVKEVAAVLLLYLPRRGLVEVWSPEQKIKVTEFQVSKNGTLLKSGGVCLDDGMPRRHEAVRVFTSFLQPNGSINHFHIPFHALSMSSTAEKDINAQNRVLSLVEHKEDKYLDELVKLLQEIRNFHLRISVIQNLLRNEQLGLQDSLILLERLNEDQEISAAENSTAKSMELKIYCNRITKLYKLLKLYNDCTTGYDNSINKTNTSDEMDELNECLGLTESELKPLKNILAETIVEENIQTSEMNLDLSAFLSSFDTEGELMKSGRVTIGLRKDFAPEVRQKLGTFFCRLASMNNAKDILLDSGVSISEVLETVLISAVRNPHRSCNWFTSMSKCFVTLLSLREGSDDKSVTSMQELSKRILLKANINEDLYAVIFLWMNSLKQVDAPQTYVDDWSRRLHQTSAIVELLACYKSLLPPKSQNKVTMNYSLHAVYDSGNGRVSEIVSSWLHHLGSCSLNISSAIDGFNETNELTLVSKVAEFFPKCMDVNILVVHMCWDELQGWCQKDRNDLDVLETAILSLSSISCTKLKVMFSHLIWRTFFSKLFRDIVRRTDEFKKSTLNESNICDKEFGLKRENVSQFLQIIQGFLDKTLELLRFGELPDVHVEYDNFSLNSQKHLLDHTLSVEPPDIDLLSLEHQFSVVLYLTWRLKLPSRPLKLFNSIEINNLLKMNTTGVVSWFSDYNTSVRSERIGWTELVSETAAGYIHRLPDSQLDAVVYKELMQPVLQISKVWFLSDVVKVGQCHALFVTGFDSLGSEIRNSFTTNELGKLSEKLLDVALLRIAKYLHQDPDTAQVATIPSEVVTEVASRRDRASSVADSSLADTLALLLWLTQNLVSEDLQMLATQCVSALQILQVRKSRATS